MMRYTYFLSLFFLVLSGSAFSQIVSVKFTDQKSGENVPNVNVLLTLQQVNSTVKDTTLQLSSSQRGKIEFKNSKIQVGTALIFKCSHQIYDSYEKTIKVKTLSDTLKLEFFLNPTKINNIKEVIVKAPGVPDTVFHSERLSVADFEVQKNGNVLLLTYPKQLAKGSELLLFDGQKVLSSFQVNDQAQYLARDYRGNTHVICKENTFGILVSDREIQVGQVPKDYFLKYIAPIVDTNSSKVYFSNFNKDYPAFEYFALDLQDSTYKTILHIEDELMMELYRSEYKWMDVRTKMWAKNKELQTGIDAEIWVGANFFTQSIYYKEVYAPMFHRNDSIFIFNYPKDRLETYDKYGNMIDSVAIFHHYHAKQTGWQRNLIQDKITGTVYAVFEKTGTTYLGVVDLKTGEIKEKVKLGFRYVDKIRVQNNFVYYVYRPFESIQKKFLYKERLPYHFSPSFTNQGTNIEVGGK